MTTLTKEQLAQLQAKQAAKNESKKVWAAEHDAQEAAKTQALAATKKSKSKSKTQAQTDASTAIAAEVHDTLMEQEFYLLKSVFYNLFVARHTLPFNEVMAKLGSGDVFTHPQYRKTFDALVRCHDKRTFDPASIGFEAKANGVDVSIVRFDELLSSSPIGSNIDAMLRDVLERRARESLLETLMAAQSDVGTAYGTDAIIQELKKRLDGFTLGQKICADDVTEFTSISLPEKKYVLEPYLREGDLAMFVAGRGTGKTFFALTLAASVACGVPAFGFMPVPEPKKALFLDGEMSALDMQRRLSLLFNGMGVTPGKGMFHLVTPDRQTGAMPNLATTEGQAAIDSLVAASDLIVVDNLSCLCPTDDENSADAWTPVNKWLLDLRRRGKCVILLHHANQSGEARGTKRREDNLDLVVKLVKPAGKYGACFDFVVSKGRHLNPSQAKAFRLELEQDGDKYTWLRGEADTAAVKKSEDDALRNEILLLRQSSGAKGKPKPLREIADDLHISLGKVQRLIKN